MKKLLLILTILLSSPVFAQDMGDGKKGARVYTVATLPTCSATANNGQSVSVSDGNKGSRTCRNTTGSTYAWVDDDPVYDVTRFGASPSASAATNATAIQAAIDACETASNGYVRIPDGTYSYSTGINPKNVKIVGSGKYTTILNYTGGTVAVNGVGTSPTRKVFTIEHLTIRGTSSSAGTRGVTLGYNMRARRLLNDVQIQGFPREAIYFADANWIVDMHDIDLNNNATETGDFGAIGADGTIASGSIYAININGATIENNGNTSSNAGAINLNFSNVQGIVGLHIMNATIEANVQQSGFPEIYLQRVNDFYLKGYTETSTTTTGVMRAYASTGKFESVQFHGTSASTTIAVLLQDNSFFTFSNCSYDSDYSNGSIYVESGSYALFEGKLTALRVDNGGTVRTAHDDVLNTSAVVIARPVNTELIGLGALASNGVLARTAAGTYAARTITGGTGVTVTDGDGVSAAPSIAIGQAVATSSDVQFGKVGMGIAPGVYHAYIYGSAPRFRFQDTGGKSWEWSSGQVSPGSAFTLRNLTDTNTPVQFLISGVASFPVGVGFTSLAFSATTPTVTSAGTSPSIEANNGTAAFTVNVGTGGTATTIVLGMPTAAAGWICHATNITATAANRADQAVRLTASTTTSVTLQNQTVSTGAALAFTASDVVRCQCTAY